MRAVLTRSVKAGLSGCSGAVPLCTQAAAVGGAGASVAASALLPLACGGRRCLHTRAVGGPSRESAPAVAASATAARQQQQAQKQAQFSNALLRGDAATALRAYRALQAAGAAAIPTSDGKLTQLVALLCAEGRLTQASGMLAALKDTVPAAAAAAVVSASAQAGQLELALRHLQQAMDMGVPVDVVACETLVNSLCGQEALSKTDSGDRSRSSTTTQAPPPPSRLAVDGVRVVLSALSAQGMAPTAALCEAALSHAARTAHAGLALTVLRAMEEASLPLSAHLCRVLHESVTRRAAYEEAEAAHVRAARRAALSGGGGAMHTTHHHHRRHHRRHHHGHHRRHDSPPPLRTRANGLNSSAAARRRTAAATQTRELQGALHEAALGVLARAGLLPEVEPPEGNGDNGGYDSLDSFGDSTDECESSGDVSDTDAVAQPSVIAVSSSSGANGEEDVLADESAFRDLLRELALCEALAADRPPDDGSEWNGSGGGWSYEVDVDELLREHEDNQRAAREHSDLHYLRAAVLDPPLPGPLLAFVPGGGLVAAAPAKATAASRMPPPRPQVAATCDLLTQLQRTCPQVEWEVDVSVPPAAQARTEEGCGSTGSQSGAVGGAMADVSSMRTAEDSRRGRRPPTGHN